ncbi:MAG: ABC transporter permease subunit [Clostridia bacterium]|nr:ABC transporter permease subunit [Clostridia bacterium]
MTGLFDQKKRRLEEGVTAAVRGDLPPVDEDSLFVEAEYDAAAAEKTGYSNYSYWRSTVGAFFHNRAAVTMLVVLALLMSFTIIQPFLPGQYAANTINNNPVTGIQLQNQSPSLTTVYATVPDGMALTGRRVDDDWYAVSNVITTIKAREKITVVEYGEDWCKIEYGDVTGYVKNNFQTKLKLPDDPTAVPYESKSSFNLSVYQEPVDYTNAGEALYARAQSIREGENGAVYTVGETELRTIPSEKAFIFGTNNIGQDLWARVWSGTRTSLFIGFVVAFFEALIGIMIGIVWGYVRALDRLLTEVYNVLDNIPNTIILILISYIMRPGIRTLIFAMSLTRWLGMARFIRNQIVIIRDRDYNLASRCLGTSTGRIMMRNLLPYLISVIMLRMALAIPGAIGSEVFITYIGLGLSVDTPSLGNLINEGRKLITSASLRYQLIFPAIVLSIITISFYIIGNAFADAADPKNHL